MTYLTISADEARKICDRLEFDASWDKAGQGYYSLKDQIDPYKLATCGGFLAYSTDSIMLAFKTKIADDSDGEVTVYNMIEERQNLIKQVFERCDTPTEFARVIAANPDLLVPVSAADVTAVSPIFRLKERYFEKLQFLLNRVVAGYVRETGRTKELAKTYRDCCFAILDAQLNQATTEVERIRINQTRSRIEKMEKRDDEIFALMRTYISNLPPYSSTAVQLFTSEMAIDLVSHLGTDEPLVVTHNLK